MNKVRLDFDLHWAINPDKFIQDPMAKQLRDLGNIIPVRLYLEPCGELIAERVFNTRDVYYIHETHFLELGPGVWSIRCEDLSEWLQLDITNMRLNNVALHDTKFTLE